MNKEEQIKLWEDFTEAKDFMLNPDRKFVGLLADGILANEKSKGYKFCPCRIGDGTKEGDIGLLCPCNFKTHNTWESQGRCWCGLFFKR